MKAEENNNHVREKLNKLNGPMTAKLIRIGKNSPVLSKEEREKSLNVEGCSALTWIHLNSVNDVVVMKIDSESMIVKGVMTLIAESLMNMSKKEILANPPVILADLGIHHHLSPNRRNGIGKVWTIIEEFCQTDH